MSVSERAWLTLQTHHVTSSPVRRFNFRSCWPTDTCLIGSLFLNTKKIALVWLSRVSKCIWAGIFQDINMKFGEHIDSHSLLRSIIFGWPSNNVKVISMNSAWNNKNSYISVSKCIWARIFQDINMKFGEHIDSHSLLRSIIFGWPSNNVKVISMNSVWKDKNRHISVNIDCIEVGPSANESWRRARHAGTLKSSKILFYKRVTTFLTSISW